MVYCKYCGNVLMYVVLEYFDGLCYVYIAIVYYHMYVVLKYFDGY